MIDGAEHEGEAITVEVRLEDAALRRRIADWLAESTAFVEGRASGAEGLAVIVADHVPEGANVPVVLMSAHPDGGKEAAARLPPRASFTRLRIALEAAAHGLAIAPPQRAPEQRTLALTPREHEVVMMLAEGASNKTIARKLGISPHTAKFHVASLLAKLRAGSRTEAVVQAARLGLLMI